MGTKMNGEKDKDKEDTKPEEETEDSEIEPPGPREVPFRETPKKENRGNT